ncbi:phthiocerol/phthiodiolone dimycocerosyl transferase family protein [Streptomyces sp. NPDC055607]
MRPPAASLPPNRPDELRRALSPLERWYWIADQISPLNTVVRIRIRGDVPFDVLRRALDALQARHPALRVAVLAGPRGRRPAFVPCRFPVPLRRVLAGPGNGTADRWVTEVDGYELSQRLDAERGPLVRAAVVTTPGEPDTHDLLFTASHVVADGRSLVSLARQWVELAALVDGGEPVPTVSARPLPAAEDLFPDRHRGPAGLARTAFHLLRDGLEQHRSRPVRLVPDRTARPAERRTRLIHRSLSTEQTRALLLACRREATTVHGALTAALVTAVARDAGTTEPAHFAVGSPVDFRAALSPGVTEDEAGSYAATVPGYLPYRPGGSLWPLARAAGCDVDRRRYGGQHFAMAGALRVLGPAAVERSDRFLRTLEKHGPINLCLSNLGRIALPDRVGRWDLTRAEVVTGVGVTGYLVAVVGTSHGRLSWNLSYVEPAIGADRAEALADACVGLLADAAGTGVTA